MYDLLSVDPHMENHCVKPTTTPKNWIGQGYTGKSKF